MCCLEHVHKPMTSIPEQGNWQASSHPAGRAPRGRGLCTCMEQVRAGRTQACGSPSKSKLYHRMAVSQFPLVFFPSVYSLLLSSSSSITIWRGSFVQIELGDGMTSNVLNNAQILIIHAGRLLLMSFSCGLKTSYFEIPLSLYPKSSANLLAYFFLLGQ